MRAVIALGVGPLAAAALSAGPAAPSADRTEQCRATLVYRGVTYYGVSALRLGLQSGPVAGTAVEPQCPAPPPRCRPGEACSPPKPRFHQVAVRRIAGVPPRVALVRNDAGRVVFVAADRCRGASVPTALLRCLRRR